MEEQILGALDSFRDLNTAILSYNRSSVTDKELARQKMLDAHNDLQNSPALDYLARYFPNVSQKVLARVDEVLGCKSRE